MRILILQFVAPGRTGALPEFEHDLGVAAAMLRSDGFEPDLLAMAGHEPEALREAINRSRPHQILAVVPPTHLTAARHTIMDVAEKHALPVGVVGRYATSQPKDTISIPGVRWLIVGEFEHALLGLLRLLRDAPAADLKGVPGVWANSAEGLVRNEPAPLIDDLDALPWPDREIFDYQRIVDATGQADFKATRGCARWCAYCLNDWYMEAYAGCDGLVRRRSAADLLDEMATVLGRYGGAREVVFLGHAFATDRPWLEAFAAEYPRRSALPYRCHVDLASVDRDVAALLARSRCRAADVMIGSGSNFIREEVLGIRLRWPKIVSGAAALAKAGVGVHAHVFVGAPYESEVSVAETLDLLARLDLQEVTPRVYYPVPGTRSAEMCADNGWISGRGEENFFAARSVLDMPSLPAERINEIARHFDSLLNRRRGRGLGGLLRRLRELGTTPLGRRAKRSR